MDNGEHATIFVMLELWDILQGSDCDDKGDSSLTKFCNLIEGDTDIADMFFGLQNISYRKSKKNEISDSASKITRSFYRKFCHIDCYGIITIDHLKFK